LDTVRLANYLANSPNKPNLPQHKKKNNTLKNHKRKTSYPGWPDQETGWPTGC